MTKIYNDNDLWECFRQRRRILGVFLGVTAFYVLCMIAKRQTDRPRLEQIV